MRGLQIVPINTKIDFISRRMFAYAAALLIVLGSVFFLVTKGLNFGIDFRGGFLLEIRTPEPSNIGNLRESLGQLGLGDVKLQEFGSDRDVMIRVERQPGGEKAQTEALERIKGALGSEVTYRRVETVGPKVSEDLVNNGIWAVTVALIGMLAYIWFRFEWQFGLCGLMALVHDCIAVLGFYAVSGFDFNESAFAAILTTVGYSINDTVVIYDRLRENLRKYKKTPIQEVMNRSLNETLSRTVLTSGTTIFALVALYWFGGPVIEAFSMPILIGVSVGTISSIFLSVNLLLYFDLRPGNRADHKEEEREETIKES